MSDPNAPQNPYEPPVPPDQQAGQPPAYGYGAPPPAAPGYGYGAPPPATPYGQPAYEYASWGQRAVATLWDWLYLWPGLIPLLVGYVLIFAAAGSSDSGGSGALGAVAAVLIIVAVVLLLWRLIVNYMLDQGRTGYTYGKRKVGIRTVKEQTGQPAGVGLAVARYFLHSLINQACYLDYLWPLWDTKRQTLTDKILTTVVVNQPPA